MLKSPIMRAALALSMLLSACALDGQGTLNPGAGAEGATTGGSGGNAGTTTGGTGGTVPQDDAGVDAAPPKDAAPDVPTGPCLTPPGTCVQSVPGGWEVVGFAVDPGSACPAGFDQTNLKANPTAPGACDCSCTITSPPCVTGSSQTYDSNSSSCGNTGAKLDINGTGCNSLGFSGNLSNYHKAMPLPVGGACAGAAVTDSSKLLVHAATLCAPSNACLEEVCTGTFPGPFGSCIRAPGDVACPAGPFVNKTLVMADVTLTCSACDSCTVSATCADPKLAFFGDANCTSPVATLAANGTCVPVTGNGSVSAFKYLVDVQNAGCAASGAKQANLAPVGPVTVCCR